LPGIQVAGHRYETDLVIFDKDGTLLDFRETWIDIIQELIAAISRRTPVSQALALRIQKDLGLSLKARSIDGCGPLAMGSAAECEAVLSACLYREGLRWDQALAVIQASEDEVFGGELRASRLRPAHGALELLKILKSRNIAVAVATNDNAAEAQRDMLGIGASAYIDLVVGADSVPRPKPAPDMVHLICERIGALPQRSVFVGDTIMDALTGRNAGVSLTIGVSGIVPAEVLREHSDVVISSLSDIG